MSDRELLEAAARAADYEIARWTDDETALLLVGVQEPWNSLHPNPHSDCMGDALRLAVRLRIDIAHGNDVVVAGGTTEERYGTEPPFAYTQAQRDAATRRAIVRAAAAMDAAGEGRKG